MPSPSSQTISPAKPRTAVRAPDADQRDQHDGRGVVETGLGLQGAGQPARQRHPTQHGEHRGRVGRRGDRAQQHRDLPAQPEHVVAEHRHHRHAHGDADGRQRDAQPHHRPDLRPRRGQATFGQDQDQRGEAERVRDLGVVELEAEPGLPQRDADEQVDEQASGGRNPRSAARPGSTAAARPPRPGAPGRACGRRVSCLAPRRSWGWALILVVRGARASRADVARTD